ncbi:MAG TPA: phosphotransferase [Gaiellaceae bacterium]|nr:phosphotransferase [Gaiellaceae bacterium]
MQDWTDATWLAGATAWIDEQVERTGEIEQPHIRPWATVLRVPTTEGTLWFKANVSALAHELPVIEVLGARLPAAVPEVVALDEAHNWLLMRDGGEQLRAVIERERKLEHWLHVLPLYAELQIAAVADVEQLIARGAPDRGLATLATQHRQLLDRVDGLTNSERTSFLALVPHAAALCDELDSVGIAETIQHDDLHDNNILTRDGKYTVFDWGDSCVTHPFLSMSVTLEGVIAWGIDDVENSADVRPFRDAYLEPFTAFAPKRELDAALDAAMRLGWVCRALTVEMYGSSLTGAAREKELAGMKLRLQLWANKVALT